MPSCYEYIHTPSQAFCHKTKTSLLANTIAEFVLRYIFSLTSQVIGPRPQLLSKNLLQSLLPCSVCSLDCHACRTASQPPIMRVYGAFISLKLVRRNTRNKYIINTCCGKSIKKSFETSQVNRKQRLLLSMSASFKEILLLGSRAEISCNGCK